MNSTLMVVAALLNLYQFELARTRVSYINVSSCIPAVAGEHPLLRSVFLLYSHGGGQGRRRLRISNLQAQICMHRAWTTVPLVEEQFRVSPACIG